MLVLLKKTKMDIICIYAHSGDADVNVILETWLSKSIFFYIIVFLGFIDRTVERDMKQGREKGNDMQQRLSGSGLKPGPAAARTIASVYGASV